MGSGFLFWAFAARLMEPTQVGFASGMVSAATLVANFAQMGVGYGIVRYLPSAEDRVDLLNWAILLCGIASISFSLLFLGGWHRVSPTSTHFVATVPMVLLYIVLVYGTTVTQLFNWFYLALKKLSYALYKNAMQTVLATILLVGFIQFVPDFQSIVLAYTAAILVSVGISLFCYLPIALPGYRLKLSFKITAYLPTAKFSIANFATDQLNKLPDTLLPLLVIAQLGADAGAYFFIVWLLGRSVIALSNSIGESLFAEGITEPSQIHANSWRSVKFGLLLASGLALAVSVSGRYILLFYGRDYVENGLNLLYLTAFAAVPGVLISVLVNMLRIQNRIRIINLIMLSSTGMGILLSYVLMPRLDLLGAGAGWFIAQIVTLLGTVLWWKWQSTQRHRMLYASTKIYLNN